MTWTTLHCQVTTPLFNGGADTRADGVRVSSLRGAMRFWFRALAGAVIGPDVDALARVERAVLGSTESASPVRLRIGRRPPVVEAPTSPDFCRGQWLPYLLGQGLWDTRNRQLARGFVAPGERFTVQARWSRDSEIDSLVLAALWLTTTYGGVGARVRRGFGGVRIAGVDGALPEPWTAESVTLSPSLDRVTHLWPSGPLGSAMPALLKVATARDVQLDLNGWGGEPPSYPVLSKTHAPASISGAAFTEWSRALSHAGEQLRWFRAQADNPGAPYRPPIKTREWIDTIHGHSNRFALGALGLPVVFTGGREVTPTDGAGPPARKARRASPLWIRAVRVGDDYRLLSFAFHGRFLPAGRDVFVWNGAHAVRSVNVENADVVLRTTAWIDAMRAGHTFVR